MSRAGQENATHGRDKRQGNGQHTPLPVHLHISIRTGAAKRTDPAHKSRGCRAGHRRRTAKTTLVTARMTTKSTTPARMPTQTGRIDAPMVSSADKFSSRVGDAVVLILGCHAVVLML